MLAPSRIVDPNERGQELASFWKNPWVKRQTLRFRRPVQIVVSPIAANFIRFVINTSTVVADPPNYVERAKQLHPSIIALWHGQFFLLAGIYPPEIPGRAMVARHEVAEALARVLRRSGWPHSRRRSGRSAPRPRRRRGGARRRRLAERKLQRCHDRRRASRPGTQMRPWYRDDRKPFRQARRPICCRHLPLSRDQFLEPHDHQSSLLEARHRHGRSDLRAGGSRARGTRASIASASRRR